MEMRIFLLCSLVVLVSCQENAQTRIPEFLMECYQDHRLLQREARLPMTMPMLIELIRKVENGPTGKNMDMRTLVIGLIQRFRLDGVVKSSKVTASSNVVPYSPLGFQFDKHKLLLSKLIPGNPIQLDNATLTSVEKCTLHHMMSSTIETESRGDEGSVCNRLSQYRTQRLPRQVNSHPDVEVMDAGLVNIMNMKGNLRLLVGDQDNVNVDVVPGVYSTGTNVPMSQCPVEDGVVQTLWGTVSVGPLLSGIAAGLQPQKITLHDLSSDGKKNIEFAGPDVVDNKFAATLAGDLAEAALRQGPVSQSKISIGAGGGWNNTQVPRWFFLSQSTNLEMTDAEIRGGLDGLILGSNIIALTSKTSSLKLSQVLDMYYSQRGIFTEKLRACNRKTLMPEVAPTATLSSQVFGFSLVLDQIMNMPVTVTEEGIRDFADKAVESISAYIPSSINDLSCSATATLPINLDIEASTDLYIFLDAQWNYNDINPSLSYLLENINVGQFGTNVTMFNAKDGGLVINSTQSISDFQQLYNESIHQSIPPGLDLAKVMQSIRKLQTEKLNNETSLKFGGGKSSIALIVTGSSTVNDADITYAMEQVKIIAVDSPDLKFLYLVSGSTDRFTQLVIDSKNDIVQLNAGNNNENTGVQMNNLVRRIKEVPRRLINRLCAAEFKTNMTGNTVLIENVAPGSINYYRLLANYFFASNEKTVVKIKGNGYGTMNICYSRKVELPRFSNSSVNNEGTVCQSVTSNTIEIPLKDACIDRSYVYQCEPFYISLEVVGSADTSQNMRCFDKSCRTPDAVQFTITMDELGCFSAGTNIVFNSLLMLSSISILLKSYNIV